MTDTIVKKISEQVTDIEQKIARLSTTAEELKKIEGLASTLAKVESYTKESLDTITQVAECAAATYKQVKRMSDVFKKTSERMDTSSPTPQKSIFSSREEEKKPDKSARADITAMLDECIRDVTKRHKSRDHDEDKSYSPKMKSKRKVSDD